MKTLYSVLGVPRNASDATIRSAFRKAAKSCHPDLHAGDPTAEQQLRQVIAAYEMLRHPQKRMAYDRYLRDSRREGMRSFALTAAAGLMSSSIMVALVLALSSTQEMPGLPQTPHVAATVSQPTTLAAVDDRGTLAERSTLAKGDRSRESDAAASGRLPEDGPRQLQQFTGSLQPTAGQPMPRALLAKEWRRVQASGDAMAIRAFAARNPHAPESELARAKLIALIDAAEDVALLNVLRLGGSGVIAERAQQRLARLSALSAAKEDHAESRAPSAHSLEARAAHFVAARVSGWSSANAANVAALANAYADKVLYYGTLKSRQAVAFEKRRFLERWPERSYEVRPDSITVQCTAHACKVSGLMDWQRRNAARTASASGVARFEYELAVARGGAFSILSETSAVVKASAQGNRQAHSQRPKATAHQQTASR